MDVESARSASSQLRGDFKALLRPQDYDVLRAVLRGEEVPNTEAKSEALYMGALLEYQDGDPWVAVHPLVRQLIEEAKSP